METYPPTVRERIKIETNVPSCSERGRNFSDWGRVCAEIREYKMRAEAAMNEVMSKLKSLDFSDLGAVIDWLEELSVPSNHIDVTTPRKEILEFFAKHGFEPGCGCKNGFGGDSDEDFARLLIGQALEDIKLMGAIHQVFQRSVEEWRQRGGYSE